MTRYHIGCGRRSFGPDWINVDGAKFPHVTSNDIYLQDVFMESVDLIYSSHLLEYFDRDEAGRLISEWFRVLKQGGILRLAVPDFESICDQYEISNNVEELLGLLYGKMELNGNFIYHKTVFDYASLATMLTEHGFKDVVKYDWRSTDHANWDDHSQAYIPHMDKRFGKLMSLNVEATK